MVQGVSFVQQDGGIHCCNEPPAGEDQNGGPGTQSLLRAQQPIHEQPQIPSQEAGNARVGPPQQKHLGPGYPSQADPAEPENYGQRNDSSVVCEIPLGFFLGLRLECKQLYAR